MKKILTHLTGIVLLITILMAGGCSPAKVPQASTEDLSVVIIYVKAVKVKEENHLEMYDSGDLGNRVIDELETYVDDSTKIYWMLADDSGLEKIKKVKPKNTGGKIMPGPAKGIWFLKHYKKHVVPGNQKSGDTQEYLIRVKDLDGKTWEIDPYLKIPDQLRDE